MNSGNYILDVGRKDGSVRGKPVAKGGSIIENLRLSTAQRSMTLRIFTASTSETVLSRAGSGR